MVLQRDEGKIVLAGALTDPVDTALFIWKNASQEVSRSHCACMRDCYQGSTPLLGRPVSTCASLILLYSVSLGWSAEAWNVCTGDRAVREGRCLCQQQAGDRLVRRHAEPIQSLSARLV